MFGVFVMGTLSTSRKLSCDGLSVCSEVLVSVVVGSEMLVSVVVGSEMLSSVVGNEVLANVVGSEVLASACIGGEVIAANVCDENGIATIASVCCESIASITSIFMSCSLCTN